MLKLQMIHLRILWSTDGKYDISTSRKYDVSQNASFFSQTKKIHRRSLNVCRLRLMMLSGVRRFLIFPKDTLLNSISTTHYHLDGAALVAASVTQLVNTHAVVSKILFEFLKQ